jgi:hypothetical protein
MREYAFHRVDAREIHARVVITAALTLGEMETVARIEIAGTGTAQMDRRCQMLFLL